MSTESGPLREHKQVDRSHYDFRRYMDKGRWASVWHQLDEVQKLQPQRVLEIGPGPGVLKHMGALFGVTVETLDLDPDLKPDHVASATALPFADASYDVVCAFQMLEHLPYDRALLAFGEMVRVARKGVVISLPDVKPVWRYSVYLPRVGDWRFMLPKPWARAVPHRFDGEHHWEINKRETPLARVRADLAQRAQLLRTWRLFDDPYYRFFVFGPDGR